MNDKAAVLLEFDYGSEGTIEKDVDIFEEFYRNRYGEEAITAFANRIKRQSFTLGIMFCTLMVLLFIPVIINSTSIFAYILLFMGLALGGVGVFFLIRAKRSQEYCRKNFDKLLDKEFASTRSVTKRLFNVCCTKEGIQVVFGVKTGIKQKRFRSYDELKTIVITDKLVFIKGLTWLCYFQMSESDTVDLLSILKTMCPTAIEEYSLLNQ